MIKKVLVLAAVVLMMGAVCAQDFLQVQETFWKVGKKNIVYEKYQLPKDLSKVEVNGAARLGYVVDTVGFVESYLVCSGTEAPQPKMVGDVLLLQSAVKAIYLLHLTTEEYSIECSNGANEIRFAEAKELNDFAEAMMLTAEGCMTMESLMPWNMIVRGVFVDMPSAMSGAKEVMGSAKSQFNIRQQMKDERMKDDPQKMESASSDKKGEKMSDRSDFNFSWAFNNWGTSQVNGLMGMSEPGYDLRTSFSSYQLSYVYDVVKTKHFALGLGLGYESDVYKFNRPYVAWGENGFAAVDTLTANGYYSSRFVTRYVQLPVQVAWSAKSSRNGLNIKLSAIPALGWCGKHTGLKHELHVEGKNPQDQMNLKEALNPYKLDVRLDVDFGGLGVFLQVATMPLMVEGAKVYPIKLGFVI